MSTPGSDATPPGLTPEKQTIRAAQYVRMSTEHQQYSTLNQQDVILEYAEKRGFKIVKTYADQGKSGLNVAGRNALRQLITDVQENRADFDVILVYDVSRWGRFQDADESAYYEHTCKKSGIEVHYCAEQFENDGGPTSTIIKSVKRAMAAEYSRELSSKVFKGQCRLIELGYRQGGPPGYGLRRMLVDMNGHPKCQLDQGEQKSLQTDRVILVPGPDTEVNNVNWIYQLFVKEGKRESEIASILNEKEILTDLGRQWNRGTVSQVLTNEKYIGNNVFNRTSFKLKKKHVRNSPEMWIRADGVFEAIVPPEIYYQAQGILQERNRKFTNDELILRLKALSEKHDLLSAALIDATEDIPTSSTYRSRFGSLINAYKLAGYIPDRNYQYLEINRHLRSLYPNLIEDVKQKLDTVGAVVTHDSTTDLLLINNEYSASMVLSRCKPTAAGSLRWRINMTNRVMPDITILARMDSANSMISDFYLLPMMDISESKLLLCETNGVYLDTYQFNDLEYFTKLAAREKLRW